MAAQPANADIRVHRRVRAYRQDLRHESVEALTKRLRPLVMSVPAEEIISGVLTRDITLSDFSPYMGEARHDATRGFPIVIGILPTVTFETAQEGLATVDFAFQIGRDKFIHNTQASLATADIHQDLRDL